MQFLQKIYNIFDFKINHISNKTLELISHISLKIALSFIVFLSSCFILANIGFLLHISINISYFYIALALSLFALLYKNNARFLSLSIFIALFIISLGFAIFLLDSSWDGRAYHQTGIYYLANSWNPVYQKMADVIELKAFLNHQKWLDYYFKFSEISASVIYKAMESLNLGGIESGKMINYLLAFASFFYAIHVGLKLRYINLFSIVILSILAAFSPIVLVQISTYYVDGLLGSVLLIVFLSILDLEIKESKIKYLIFILSMLLASSIKLTGLGYCGFIGIVYLIYKILTSLKSAKYLALSGAIIAILVILNNFNPLFTNMLEGKHPGYPLMGDNKVDIITKQQPKNFNGLSSSEKLFLSLFSKTQNISRDKESTLKVPFFKASGEKYMSVDTRVAGFGFYFSGVIVLCAILMLLYHKQILKKPYILMFLLILGSVLINKEAWWARYVPQMYFLPFIFILATYSFMPKLSYLRIFMIFLLAINLYAPFKNAKDSAVSYSNNVNNLIKNISMHSNEKTIYFTGWRMDKSFAIKLQERGIKTHMVDVSDEEMKTILETNKDIELIPFTLRKDMYWSSKTKGEK